MVSAEQSKPGVGSRSHAMVKNHKKERKELVVSEAIRREDKTLKIRAVIDKLGDSHQQGQWVKDPTGKTNLLH